MKQLLLMIAVVVSLPCAAGAEPDRRTPDQFRALRAHQTVQPTFPRTLIDRGVVHGFARVVIDVDATGRLADWLVVGYSRREFSESAVAAVREWTFDPMIANGQPVPSQVLLAFNFEAKGVVISISADTPAIELMAPSLFEKNYGPCTMRDLDGIPEPRATLKAPYPAELHKRGVQGTVVVEFYIDESGVVRMPAVVSADFPELGDLAIEAVRSWSFAPPTRRGAPVLVHARQKFNFGAEEP